MGSYRDIQAAKHSLLEITEACIDIANYIISVKGFRRAEGYNEMFEVLKEEKTIGEDLANKLKDMARFRNLLVHRYAEVDNEEDPKNNQTKSERSERIRERNRKIYRKRNILNFTPDE